jgi:hypothetical protein
MRGWFRSLGVGTTRNNRPLPRGLLLALSGHWFGRRACPLLGVKQTSLAHDQVSVNDPRVDFEENRQRVSNSTFPAKNYGLPAP